ncbi:MAG: 30S ribosomal protein S15 [Bdellovibrionales bacterium]
MQMSKEKKEEIVKKFKKTSQDTGSSQVQVALLTEKIKELTEHFKIHKKDFHSMRGLIKMVSLRKKILNYMKRKEVNNYKKVIQELKLRK